MKSKALGLGLLLLVGGAGVGWYGHNLPTSTVVTSTPGSESTAASATDTTAQAAPPDATPDTAPAATLPSLDSSYHVVHVDDGDTLDVARGVQQFRVRLIGVDTPEVVDPRKPVQCFGREASTHTKSLLPVGTAVTLEFDPSVGVTDKYGRTLAYVWLGDTNLNEALVRDGFAHEYTYQNIAYKYQAQFRDAEAWARSHSLGLWSAATCNGDTTKAATNS